MQQPRLTNTRLADNVDHAGAPGHLDQASLEHIKLAHATDIGREAFSRRRVERRVGTPECASAALCADIHCRHHGATMLRTQPPVHINPATSSEDACVASLSS